MVYSACGVNVFVFFDVIYLFVYFCLKKMPPQRGGGGRKAGGGGEEELR